MTKTLLFAVGVALCSGCSSTSNVTGSNANPAAGDDAAAADAGASLYIQGFNPPPVAAGYTRYVTPVIDNITPGFDALYCQWLTPPAQGDQDVVDLTGLQSKDGHHIVLYAQSEVNAVGTSRVCTTADMLSITFLGAIGGEGTSTIFSDMPPNTVFRLPKGQALMANTHFLNTSGETVQGQGVIDVKFDTPTPSHKVAGSFNNVGDTFSIPPNATNYAYDISCPIQQDMQFFAITNHMHAYGTSVYTEVIHANGSKATIVDNRTDWTSDMEFNPKYAVWPATALLSINKGDTVHTHCEWTNTTGKAMQFPDEMCVAAGFNMTPGAGVNCIDAQWP